MSQLISSPELFLAAFHDSNPGITSRAVSGLAVLQGDRRFTSSYECLANEIPSCEAPRTLLDLACGDGYLLSLFAERERSNLTLIGVDLSQGELDAARRRLGGGATLQLGRAQALPVAAESLDYVVCHMALMLMDEIDEVLAQVHRVMKKGAVFAAIVGARPPPSPIFDAYLALLSQFPRETKLSGMRFGDPRVRTRDGIARLFSKGFEKIVIQELLSQRRYTPSELSVWLEDSYDFHMLKESAQKDFSAKFIPVIESLCASDGKVEYCTRSFLICAVAV